MRKELGQYMTPIEVVDFMISLVEGGKYSSVLEPSSGEGDFIHRLLKHGYKDITAFEIDKEIIGDNINHLVNNKSFIGTNYNEEFDLVIGNPPYIRWKNLGEDMKEEVKNDELFKEHLNSLVDYSAIFILKSIQALKEGGELIFITPDYWLNSTHSNKLRDYMVRHGQFSDIYLLKETKIFKNATVSVMVFRYVKTKENLYPKINIRTYPKVSLDKDALYGMKNKKEDEINFTVLQFEEGKSWRMYNDRIAKVVNKLEEVTSYKGLTVGDVSEIGNGMISGLDKAFQITEEELTDKELASTINVIKGRELKGYWYEDEIKYIFIEDELTEAEFKKNYPTFYEQLFPYKSRLMKRYNYNREINYWEWVFLRNYSMFSTDKEKIFVPGKDRISHKDYFRFSIVPPEKFPTQDVTALVPKDNTEESIEYITGYLNSYWVFEWLKNKGTMKGHIVEFSHRPVSSIPYLSIDFDDEFEVGIHEKITSKVKETISNKDRKDKEIIDGFIEDLIDYKLAKKGKYNK